MGFASWLRYCSDVAQRRSTRLCTMFGRLHAGLVHCIYIFWGSCPVTEFCHVQNSLCVQLLHSPILAALLHGIQAVGVSESLRRHTRNRITELLQRAPSIFGWAAITLGIGPHSISFFFSRLISAVADWMSTILPHDVALVPI